MKHREEKKEKSLGITTKVFRVSYNILRRENDEQQTSMGIHLYQFQLGEVHQHTAGPLGTPLGRQRIPSYHLLFGMLHDLFQ